MQSEAAAVRCVGKSHVSSRAIRNAGVLQRRTTTFFSARRVSTERRGSIQNAFGEKSYKSQLLDYTTLRNTAI